MRHQMEEDQSFLSFKMDMCKVLFGSTSSIFSYISLITIKIPKSVEETCKMVKPRARALIDAMKVKNSHQISLANQRVEQIQNEMWNFEEV